MDDLFLAAVFFVATHLGIASTPLRGALIDRLGPTTYRAVYSGIALLALIWLVRAYLRAPFVELWEPVAASRFLAVALMPLVFLLLVCAVTAPNPTAAGQKPDVYAAEPVQGIQRITRHPLMWAVILWGSLHILATGHLAALVLFGSLVLTAAAGSVMIDHRRIQEGEAGWGIYLQRSSNLPFLAILQGRQKLVPAEIGWARAAGALALYLLLLFAHPYLFGPRPVG